jgi:hypothetical protein
MDTTGDEQAGQQEGGRAEEPQGTRSQRLRSRWMSELGPGERSATLAWASFAATFGIARAITHWIRGGHGPSSGGVSVGGRHFHHYNLGILILTIIGAVAVRGQERHRRHPLTAIAFGTATALIADEAALLIDLEDVYWSSQGRISVDVAVGGIAVGGLGIAGASFWPAALHELRKD